MSEELLQTSPLDELEKSEYNKLVVYFCSYVCQLKNKKMNYPSIFVTILEDDDLFDYYVDFCGFSDKREAVLEFLKFDESIIKSKFLKKIVNNGKRHP